MKTTTCFFALVTVAVLASCSKEDEAPSVDQSILVGEWNLEEYNYSGTTSASQGGSTMTIDFVGEFYDIDARLILNSDNTYRSEGSYMVELTTTTEGETLTEQVAVANAAATGTYRIENDRILTDNTEVQQPMNSEMMINEGTIVELTANRLVIVFNQNITTETQGAAVNISLEGLQVYSR